MENLIATLARLDRIDAERVQSCPRCSLYTGARVYYPFADFGKRFSVKALEGENVQGWCQPCRAYKVPSVEGAEDIDLDAARARLREGGLPETIILKTPAATRKRLERVAYLESALTKMDPDTQGINITAINNSLDALRAELEA